MSIFISWSGKTSGQVARALEEWLRVVLQGCDPWISSSIESGARWSSEIAARLDSTSTGILCVTPDNQDAPWLVFEAGALAKSATDARVCPYLFGLRVAQLREGPLTQFQAREADEAGTWELVRMLNARLDTSVGEAELERLYRVMWPELAKVLASIDTSATAPAARSAEEMLEEVLTLTRAIVLATNPPPTTQPRVFVAKTDLAFFDSATGGAPRLKEVLRRYPGRDRVEVQLLTPDGCKVLRMGEEYLVDSTNTGLHRELAELLGDAGEIARFAE